MAAVKSPINDKKIKQIDKFDKGKDKEYEIKQFVLDKSSEAQTDKLSGFEDDVENLL